MPLYRKLFQFNISLQQILHLAVLLVVLGIMLAAYRSLQHPIGLTQMQQLDRLARQQVYPHTQSLAMNILTEYEYISYAQYLKVMHAQQNEQRQAKQLPALQVD